MPPRFKSEMSVAESSGETWRHVATEKSGKDRGDRRPRSRPEPRVSPELKKLLVFLSKSVISCKPLNITRHIAYVLDALLDHRTLTTLQFDGPASDYLKHQLSCKSSSLTQSASDIKISSTDEQLDGKACRLSVSHASSLAISRSLLNVSWVNDDTARTSSSHGSQAKASSSHGSTVCPSHSSESVTLTVEEELYNAERSRLGRKFEAVAATLQKLHGELINLSQTDVDADCDQPGSSPGGSGCAICSMRINACKKRHRHGTNAAISLKLYNQILANTVILKELLVHEPRASIESIEEIYDDIRARVIMLEELHPTKTEGLGWAEDEDDSEMTRDLDAPSDDAISDTMKAASDTPNDSVCSLEVWPKVSLSVIDEISSPSDFEDVLIHGDIFMSETLRSPRDVEIKASSGAVEHAALADPCLSCFNNVVTYSLAYDVDISDSNESVKADSLRLNPGGSAVPAVYKSSCCVVLGGTSCVPGNELTSCSMKRETSSLVGTNVSSGTGNCAHISDDPVLCNHGMSAENSLHCSTEVIECTADRDEQRAESTFGFVAARNESSLKLNMIPVRLSNNPFINMSDVEMVPGTINYRHYMQQLCDSEEFPWTYSSNAVKPDLDVEKFHGYSELFPGHHVPWLEAAFYRVDDDDDDDDDLDCCDVPWPDLPDDASNGSGDLPWPEVPGEICSADAMNDTVFCSEFPGGIRVHEIPPGNLENNRKFETMPSLSFDTMLSHLFADISHIGVDSRQSVESDFVQLRGQLLSDWKKLADFDEAYTEACLQSVCRGTDVGRKSSTDSLVKLVDCSNSAILSGATSAVHATLHEDNLDGDGESNMDISSTNIIDGRRNIEESTDEYPENLFASTCNVEAFTEQGRFPAGGRLFSDEGEGIIRKAGADACVHSLITFQDNWIDSTMTNDSNLKGKEIEFDGQNDASQLEFAVLSSQFNRFISSECRPIACCNSDCQHKLNVDHLIDVNSNGADVFRKTRSTSISVAGQICTELELEVDHMSPADVIHAHECIAHVSPTHDEIGGGLKTPEEVSCHLRIVSEGSQSCSNEELIGSMSESIGNTLKGFVCHFVNSIPYASQEVQSSAGSEHRADEQAGVVNDTRGAEGIACGEGIPPRDLTGSVWTVDAFAQTSSIICPLNTDNDLIYVRKNEFEDDSLSNVGLNLFRGISADGVKLHEASNELVVEKKEDAADSGDVWFLGDGVELERMKDEVSRAHQAEVSGDQFLPESDLQMNNSISGFPWIDDSVEENVTQHDIVFTCNGSDSISQHAALGESHVHESHDNLEDSLLYENPYVTCEQVYCSAINSNLVEESPPPQYVRSSVWDSVGDALASSDVEHQPCSQKSAEVSSGDEELVKIWNALEDIFEFGAFPPVSTVAKSSLTECDCSCGASVQYKECMSALGDTVCGAEVFPRTPAIVDLVNDVSIDSKDTYSSAKCFQPKSFHQLSSEAVACCPAAPAAVALAAAVALPAAVTAPAAVALAAAVALPATVTASAALAGQTWEWFSDDKEHEDRSVSCDNAGCDVLVTGERMNEGIVGEERNEICDRIAADEEKDTCRALFHQQNYGPLLKVIREMCERSEPKVHDEVCNETFNLSIPDTLECSDEADEAKNMEAMLEQRDDVNGSIEGSSSDGPEETVESESLKSKRAVSRESLERTTVTLREVSAAKSHSDTGAVNVEVMAIDSLETLDIDVDEYEVSEFSPDEEAVNFIEDDVIRYVHDEETESSNGESTERFKCKVVECNRGTSNESSRDNDITDCRNEELKEPLLEVHVEMRDSSGEERTGSVSERVAEHTEESDRGSALRDRDEFLEKDMTDPDAEDQVRACVDEIIIDPTMDRVTEYVDDGLSQYMEEGIVDIDDEETLDACDHKSKENCLELEEREFSARENKLNDKCENLEIGSDNVEEHLTQSSAMQDYQGNKSPSQPELMNSEFVKDVRLQNLSLPSPVKLSPRSPRTDELPLNASDLLIYLVPSNTKPASVDTQITDQALSLSAVEDDSKEDRKDSSPNGVISEHLLSEREPQQTEDTSEVIDHGSASCPECPCSDLSHNGISCNTLIAAHSKDSTEDLKCQGRALTAESSISDLSTKTSCSALCKDGRGFESITSDSEQYWTTHSSDTTLGFESSGEFNVSDSEGVHHDVSSCEDDVTLTDPDVTVQSGLCVDHSDSSCGKGIIVTAPGESSKFSSLSPQHMTQTDDPLVSEYREEASQNLCVGSKSDQTPMLRTMTDDICVTSSSVETGLNQAGHIEIRRNVACLPPEEPPLLRANIQKDVVSKVYRSIDMPEDVQVEKLVDLLQWNVVPAEGSVPAGGTTTGESVAKPGEPAKNSCESCVASRILGKIVAEPQNEEIQTGVFDDEEYY